MGQPYTPAQEASMKETMDCLTRIPQQLRKHISPKPRPTVQELKRMGKWLDAPQLVQLVVRLKVSSPVELRVGLGCAALQPCHPAAWAQHKAWAFST
jgi:hypothetical protein